MRKIRHHSITCRQNCCKMSVALAFNFFVIGSFLAVFWKQNIWFDNTGYIRTRVETMQTLTEEETEPQDGKSVGILTAKKFTITVAA